MKKTLFLALVILTMVCLLVIGASAYELNDEDTAAAAAGTPVKVVYAEPIDLGDGTFLEYEYVANITEALKLVAAYDGVCDKIVIVGNYTEDALVVLAPQTIDLDGVTDNTADNPLVIEGNGFVVKNLTLQLGDGTHALYVEVNNLTFTSANAAIQPKANVVSKFTGCTIIGKQALNTAVTTDITFINTSCIGTTNSQPLLQIGAANCKITIGEQGKEDSGLFYGLNNGNALMHFTGGGANATTNIYGGTFVMAKNDAVVLDSSKNFTTDNAIFNARGLINIYGGRFYAGSGAVLVSRAATADINMYGGTIDCSGITIQLPSVGDDYAVTYTSTTLTPTTAEMYAVAGYSSGKVNLQGGTIKMGSAKGVAVFANGHDQWTIGKVTIETKWNAIYIFRSSASNTGSFVIDGANITGTRECVHIRNNVSGGITIKNATIKSSTPSSSDNYCWGIYLVTSAAKLSIIDSTIEVPNSHANYAAVRNDVALSSANAIYFENVVLKGYYGFDVRREAHIAANSSISASTVVKGAILRAQGNQATLYVHEGSVIKGSAADAIIAEGSSLGLHLLGTANNKIIVENTSTTGYTDGVDYYTNGSLTFQYAEITGKYGLHMRYNAPANGIYENCKFVGNQTGKQWGGGVCFERSNMTGTMNFVNCELVSENSYALHVSAASSGVTVIFTDCTLTGAGGGVYAHAALGTLTLNNTKIHNYATSTYANAGVYANGAITNININAGTEIISDQSNGVYVKAGTNLVIAGTEAKPVKILVTSPAGNTYTNGVVLGGALAKVDVDWAEIEGAYAFSILTAPTSTITIDNSKITGNSKTTNNVGGLWVQADATIVVNNSEIRTIEDHTKSTANVYAICMYQAAANITVNNSVISGFRGAYGFSSVNAEKNATVTLTNCELNSVIGTVIYAYGGTKLTMTDCSANITHSSGLFNASDASTVTIYGGNYVSTGNEVLGQTRYGATVSIYGGYFQHQGVYMFQVQGFEDAPSTLNIYGGYFYRPAVQKGQEDSSTFIRVGGAGDKTQIGGADTPEDETDDVYEYNYACYGIANVWGGTFVADHTDAGSTFAVYHSKSVLNLQSYVAKGAALLVNYLNTDIEEGFVLEYHQNKALLETTYNSLKIITGASMRLVYTVEGDVAQSGLRFTSYVTKGFQDMVASKADGAVEYYTVIVPARFITGDYFTVESLTEAGANPLSIKAENGIAYNADGDMFIRASVYNLPHTTNGSQMTYADGYAAIVYAKFTVDGKEVCQYAHFDASENVVSPADIANAALNDTSDEETGDYVNQIPVDGGFVWSPYTAEQRSILAVYAAESKAEEMVDVFVIAGQSNASGYSHMTDAFASAHSTGYSNVLYTGMAAYSGHTGAAGTYHNITPVNSGLGYSSKAIGAELGMADVLDAIYNADSNRTALIIKYADGGTYLSDHANSHKEGHNGNWMSPTSIAKLGKNHEYYTGRQYENLMEVIKKAVTEVKLQGYGVVNFKGLFWMQGESDRNISSLTVNGQEITFTKNGTSNFEMLDVNLPYSYPNLFKNLVTDFRRDVQKYADNDTSALPVVVGTISEAFGRVHHDANKYFVDMQMNTLPSYVSGITTLDISMLPVSRDNDNSDAAHWSAEDMFLIGQMVGATFAGLDNPAITTDTAKAVCRIGSTYYTSLSYALGVAKAGQTVELTKNITLTSTLNIANTNSITLDGNGYTVTTACNNAMRLIGTNLAIKDVKFALSSVTNFVVTHEEAKYTLSGVSYDIANPDGKEPAAQVYDKNNVLIGTFYTIDSAFNALPDGGKITLLQSFESATPIQLPANSSYTIDGNGNTFTFNGVGTVALYVSADSDLTVKNLNVTVTDATSTTYIAYAYEGASLTVIGGTYTAPNYGFMMRKANLTLVLDGVTVNMTGTGAAPHASNPRTAIGFNSASVGASVTVKNGSKFVGADAANTYFVHVNSADPVLSIDLDTTSISGMTFSELSQETVVLNGKLAALTDYSAKLNVLKGGSIYATVGTPSQVCINVNSSNNRPKLTVSNYIDINGNATTLAESPIKLSSNGNIYNNYILLDRAEGGTMDDTGAYYYTVFMKSDELPKALGKVNVATGAVQYISDATMQLDHANDVAFIPGTNGANDRLAVVLNGEHAKWVAIYEDTGSGFEFVEFVKTLPQNIWCLEYNAATNQYVAGVSGASFQYMILNENFELVKTFEGVRCDFTKQSVYCDASTIYFCLDDGDVIMTYDWNGNYTGAVILDDYLGNQETEGIAIRGGYAYVLVLDQDASTTTNAYKVINILKYKLTLK